ncbi:MAG TPA: hypothetical protein DCS89_05255 [Gammaproteobacteria bacterium]|nr:hypothetical protein [Gammaproteobacteria bacterium]
MSNSHFTQQTRHPVNHVLAGDAFTEGWVSAPAADNPYVLQKLIPLFSRYVSDEFVRGWSRN